jgi:hypothetical protein
MRWTVPVPMPSDFATFKIPTPFASCFRTFRSVAAIDLRPAELHALSDGALGAGAFRGTGVTEYFAGAASISPR